MKPAIPLLPLICLLLLSCAAKPAASLIPLDYDSWERTTDILLNYPIPGHENRLRIPHMNSIGFESLPAPGAKPRVWSFAKGTIIAKAVFASPNPPPGEAPVMVTAMIKAPDDPRSRSGWIWVVKDLSAGKERVFTENFCVTCHGNANEKHPYADKNSEGEFRDFVFIVPERVLAAPASKEGEEYEYGNK